MQISLIENRKYFEIEQNKTKKEAEDNTNKIKEKKLYRGYHKER